MKKYSICLLFLIFVNISMPVHSEIFYLIRGEKVELDILFQGKHSKKIFSAPDMEIPVLEFKKICTKSADKDYEVGLKNNTSTTLKAAFPCYLDEDITKKNNPTKFTFFLKWVEGKVRLKSNSRKILIAEGRSGDAIEISNSSFPSVSIDLANKPFIKVELKLIQNKKLIYTKKANENFVFINDLEVNNMYLLTIYDEKGTIKMSQRFVITE